MRRLLCVSGKRFSGKDTFAGFLVSRAETRGVRLATYAFAGESKRLFAESQHKSGVEVDLGRLSSDRAYKEVWRPALTRFTVAALAEDPLVFCRAVTERIEATHEPALITDLRLRLEIDYLRPRFDLLLVRLLRSDESRARSGWRFDAAIDGHHTETELDDPTLWGEVVTNDGTPAELESKAEAVLTAHLG